MVKKLTEDTMVIVPLDFGQGLTAMAAPAIMEKQCREMRITDAEGMLYFSAALYFCKCAHHSIELHAKQVTLEDEVDHNARLRNVLESCMRFYGIDDIEKMMRFVNRCRLYAFNNGLLWEPRLQAWLDSAGRAYDEQTREEKAWDKSN